MPSRAQKDCQVHCLTVTKAVPGWMLTSVSLVTHLGTSRWQALWQLVRTGLTTKSLTVTGSHDEQVSKGDGDDPLYVVECDLAGRTMNIVNPAGETCIYIQKRWASCAHCLASLPPSDACGSLDRCALRHHRAGTTHSTNIWCPRASRAL